MSHFKDFMEKKDEQKEEKIPVLKKVYYNEEEVKKIEEPKKPVKTEKYQPSIKEIDFSDTKITQDDLWIIHRVLFGKPTRMKKSKLLPKFIELFNRNLKTK